MIPPIVAPVIPQFVDNLPNRLKVHARLHVVKGSTWCKNVSSGRMDNLQPVHNKWKPVTMESVYSSVLVQVTIQAT